MSLWTDAVIQMGDVGVDPDPVFCPVLLFHDSIKPTPLLGPHSGSVALVGGCYGVGEWALPAASAPVSLSVSFFHVLVLFTVDTTGPFPHHSQLFCPS